MSTTLVLDVEEQTETVHSYRQAKAFAVAVCPVCFSDQVAALYDGGVYCLECNQRSGSNAV